MAVKRYRAQLKTQNSNTVAEVSPEQDLCVNYNFNTKLDAAHLKRMCVLLEEGLPVVTACEFLGISVSAHTQWLIKGRQYVMAIEEGNAPPKLEWKLYAIYLIEVRKSVATYLKGIIGDINSTFTPAWVRDMTILERRDYQNWGRNVTVTEREDIKNPDESFL